MLYDTHVGDYAQLGPLTVVMKGETIPANSAWIGAPAEPAARPRRRPLWRRRDASQQGGVTLVMERA